jgi:cell division protein FtsW
MVLWVTYLIKRVRWPFSDTFLLPVAVFISFLGMIFLCRLDPVLAEKQAVRVALGLGAVGLLSFLPGYRALVEFKYLAAAVALSLLAATLVFGVAVGGAKSWLEIGPIRFEPVELVKLLLVVFLAGYLEDQNELLRVNWKSLMGIGMPAPQATLPLLVIWGISLLLVAFQRDLGGALLLFLTFMVMLFLATGRRWYLGFGGVLLVLGVLFSYFTFDHVRERVGAWLNPWPEAHGTGYQLVQGLFGIAGGGLLGTGLGGGHPELVPAVATDYLFVALAEEMGLAGSLGLISLYTALVCRGFRVAMLAKDLAGSLLAAGSTALLALQALVILGGILRFMPLTGVTLPFFSYGGSSTLVSYLFVGLLLKVSYESGRLRRQVSVGADLPVGMVFDK